MSSGFNARREHRRPGAQPSLCDAAGRRLQVLLTNITDNHTNGADIAYIEALHRGHGRVERRISDHRTPGWPNSCKSFAVDAVRLQLSMTAHDLLAWTRLPALDGDLAEPERLRHCLLHNAARLTRTGRRTHRRTRRRLALDPPPATAFDKIHKLPLLI